MTDTDGTKGFMAKLNAMKGLILAAAALITAIGSWFRPQDMKVTKSSYETLAASIEEIGKEVDKNHDDIIAIRGYLDGLVKNGNNDYVPVPVPVSFPSSSPSASASAVTYHPIYFIKPKPASSSSVSPVPSVHIKPAPVSTWKMDTFDAVKAKAK